MGRLIQACILAGALAAAAAAPKPLGRACEPGCSGDIWGEGTLVNFPASFERGDGLKDLRAEQIEVPCQCSDVEPRDEYTSAIPSTCYQQRIFGNCDQPWMFDANAELAPEAYCQISCSRCNCCVPPSEVASQLGGGRFLDATRRTGENELIDMLTHPGFAATVLVPTDAAFEALGARADDRAFMKEVIKMHILPPDARRNALWTSPFFALGPQRLATLANGTTLAVEKFPLPAGTTWRGGLAGWTIAGPANAATVLSSDAPSCKGYVNIIDTVLLPAAGGVRAAAGGRS